MNWQSYFDRMERDIEKAIVDFNGDGGSPAYELDEKMVAIFIQPIPDEDENGVRQTLADITRIRRTSYHGIIVGVGKEAGEAKNLPLRTKVVFRRSIGGADFIMLDLLADEEKRLDKTIKEHHNSRYIVLVHYSDVLVVQNPKVQTNSWAVPDRI